MKAQLGNGMGRWIHSNWRSFAQITVPKAIARFGMLCRQLFTILRKHDIAQSDSPTQEERSAERRRRALLTSLAAMVAKFVSVASALITIPITLRYLGPERYGMWLIMSSLMAMLSFADLGIGNGMLNTIAAAFGRDDESAIKDAISSGAVALGAITASILLMFVVAYPFIDWSVFFNVHSPLAKAEAGPAVASFVTCFALSIPMTIVQRVQLGLQRGFLASLWLCLGSAIALPAIIIATLLHASLPVLVAVFMGAPLVAGLGNTLLFFGRQQPMLRPTLKRASRIQIISTVRQGLLFVLIQLGNSVTAGSAVIIIAHVASPSKVAEYAVPERLLALVTMLVSMYVQPLWPAYREAIVRGDSAWVTTTYRRSLTQVGLTATGALLCLGITMPVILHYWVGEAVNPPLLLISGLCFYKLVESLLWVNAILLNGLQALTAQTYMALINAALYIILVVAACSVVGVSAVPWIGVTVLTLVTLLPGYIIIRRNLSLLNLGV